jgi:predicted dehydrogenase
MNADGPLRVGIVGAGNIGTAYAMALGSSSSVTVTAVCDTDEERSRALASTTGAISFDSHESLAESGACDAVIVSTPPVTHAPVSIGCLERGLDVLCEKPFALDLSSAREMFDAASRSGRLLAMASKFRYVPDISQTRNLVRFGAIGDPTVVDVTFVSQVDMSGRWNSVPSISGGGVLVDNGTHAVDIIRYLVGPIVRVSAMRGRPDQFGGVEDTALILAETTCHTIANIQVSWSIAPYNESFAAVHGTAGSIKVGWSESTQWEPGGGEWTSFGSGYSKMEALRLNVEDFAAASRGHGPMRISTADVIASVSVIDAAYKAISTGQWIGVDEPAWPYEMADDRAASSVG